MNQTLVISKKYYDSINDPENFTTINSYGLKNADNFLNSVIKKLNDEYAFFDLKGFRFFTDDEAKNYTMYSAFIDNFNNDEYNSTILCFTPVQSKLGNTIVSQELMPIVAKEMNKKIDFLLNKKIKKIFVLTSQINKDNVVKDDESNTLQLNVNSLNTIGFDVIQFLRVKGLTSNAGFSNLDEYLSLLNDLRKRQSANDQTEYISEKSGIVIGKCDADQIEGQFPKFFSFRFLTAMMLGKSDFQYDISGATKHNRGGNQFDILNKFVLFVNKNNIGSPVITDEDIEDPSPIEIDRINDENRTPEMSSNLGSRRYKTKRFIREEAIKARQYKCDCHDEKHFYFESSSNLENYVEGHHIIPMNRQEAYWNDYKINLDVINNIVPLCPNCHTQVHLGSRGAKLIILSELYSRNEKNLKQLDKHLSFTKLANYYNILISNEEESYYLKFGEKSVRTKSIL